MFSKGTIRIVGETSAAVTTQARGRFQCLENWPGCWAGSHTHKLCCAVMQWDVHGCPGVSGLNSGQLLPNAHSDRIQSVPIMSRPDVVGVFSI